MIKAIRMPEPTGTFDSTVAAAAQRRYCAAKSLPMFAPSDGRCGWCHGDIDGKGRYSVEEAGSGMITGCPICHRSFCD
jgi:hypothetical protein